MTTTIVIDVCYRNSPTSHKTLSNAEHIVKDKQESEEQLRFYVYVASLERGVT